MPRRLLPLVALLLLIVAGLWLLDDPSAAGAGPTEKSPSAAAGRVEPARFADEPTGADAARAEDPQRVAVSAPEAAAGQPPPAAWFRGRLRIVEGALHHGILLEAEVAAEAAVEPSGSSQSIRVGRDDLAFAIRAPALEARAVLRLPFPLEAVAVEGAGRVEDGVVHLDRPADDLVVDARVRPHLAALFLHDPSGAPLAGAAVESKLEKLHSSTSWGERTDADGFLIFDLARRAQMEGAETLTFTVSRPPDVGSSAAAPIPCADLELLPQPLVLRFASTPRLRFRIVDPDRAPIAGARLRLGSQWEEALTAEDGRIEALQASPPAERVLIEADGFIAGDEAIAATAGNSEQEVALWPASWIEVVGGEEPAEGWHQLEVELSFDGDADGSLLAPERFITGRFTEHSGNTGVSYNRSERRFKHDTQLNEQGRARLDGIHVDVPATLSVRFRGALLLEQRIPLQPGDGGHRVDLPALPSLARLHGRVVSASGAPLAGVRIAAAFAPEKSSFADTDAEGRFDLGSVVAGSRVQLGFTKEGVGRALRDHLAEADDADSIGTVVLEPGRSLVLQILRPDGTPFIARPGTLGAEWSPHALFLGQIVSPAPRNPAAPPGEWRFADLPAGTLEFVLPGASEWRDVRHLVDTAQPRVALTLTPEAAERLELPPE